MVSLAEAVEAGIAAAFEGIHTCLPGMIEEYDPATRMASVKPLVKKKYANDTVAPMPVLVSVPVVWPAGSGGGVSFPLKHGDGVLLLFAERNIENFLVLGGDSLPNDGRKFDLTDCIAIPGLYSFKDPGFAPDNVNAYFKFGGITLKITPDAKVAIGKPAAELLDLVEQLCDALLNSTTATLMGPQPLSVCIGGDVSRVGIIKSKINSIKATL